MPKLLTITGPTQGREFELEDLCILGRSPNCQIYIGELTVSRQHARICKSDRSWIIEDLGSGNGTYVNEVRIVRRVLQNSDEIRISKSSFRFIADVEQSGRWINMVTVLAGNEPGLITADSSASIVMAAPDAAAPEASLRADLTKAHRMLETLYAVTGAISSILEPKELFDRILNYLFDNFPVASQGFIMLLDPKGQLVPVAIRQRRGEASAGGLVVSQAVVAKVLHEGKSVLSTGNPRETWSGTCKMCAPLAAQGRILGILLIEGSGGVDEFSQGDLDLLSGIALLAGSAIHSANQHQQLMSQQRLEQDMKFARQVQQSFLPAEPPEVPGFLFSRSYSPAFEVGGDFFDFISLPGRRMGVVIGDVSGKGVSAALLMARLTSDIRYFASAEPSPAQVLTRANASLLRTVQDNMFATVLYLVLDLEQRAITISNAGHLPPLICRGADRQVAELDEATSLALGVLPDAEFAESTVPLESGDTVLLCTDGVTEAKSPLQEEYGFQRLYRALTLGRPDSLLSALLLDLQRHTAMTPQYDDITMVAFTRVG